MSEVKEYAQRDLMGMDFAGNHYCRHVSAMTREQLHSKSDIAAELGWRDMQIAKLTAERDALAAENVSLKSAISYVCDTDNQPDYQYDGMGCGIEDRGIVDRYEAARYGWDEALERMYSEVIPCASDIETPATDAYLNTVRAGVIKQLHSEQKEWALVTWQYDSFDALKRAAVRHGDSELSGVIFMLDRIEGFAAQLRAGEPS